LQLRFLLRYFISLNPKIINTIVKVKQLVSQAKNCYKIATALLHEILGHKPTHLTGRKPVSKRDTNGLCQGIFLNQWPKIVMLTPELSFYAHLHTILEIKLFRKGESEARLMVAVQTFDTYPATVIIKTGENP